MPPIPKPAAGTPAALDLQPSPPLVHHEPQELANGVFLIRQLFGEGIEPMCVYANSLVIDGEEPVLVDTGSPNNREQWLDDVFGIVAAQRVRWIFISHDDIDHIGNLEPALQRCPNATLVVSWLTVQRLAGEFNLPRDRMRWVNGGEQFAAGGRTLVALRPPTFDSPTTRGLFDTRTGLYWASDSFGAGVPHHVDHASDLPGEVFSRGLSMFNRTLAPWVSLADPQRFRDAVHAIRALEPSAIASCHGPVIGSAERETVLGVMERLPLEPSVQPPGQDALDAMLAAMTSVGTRAPAGTLR